MKFILLTCLALSSLSALARSPEEVMDEIEAREGVQCYQVDESNFKVCLGAPADFAVYRWTKTFDCFGNSEFTVKLKLKSAYSNSRSMRETTVTKITTIR